MNYDFSLVVENRMREFVLEYAMILEPYLSEIDSQIYIDSIDGSKNTPLESIWKKTGIEAFSYMPDNQEGVFDFTSTNFHEKYYWLSFQTTGNCNIKRLFGPGLNLEKTNETDEYIYYEGGSGSVLIKKIIPNWYYIEQYAPT